MLQLDQDYLETDRLIMRPVAEADLPRIVALANNRAVAQMLLRMPHPYSDADARAWLDLLATLPAGAVTFAIGCKAEDGAFIGGCGYDPLLTGIPDLGYWLGEPYWGRGLASEAAAAVVAHAFEVAGLDTLTSGYRPDNPASGRVLHKLGFKPDGRKTAYSLGAGGEIDINVVKLTRNEWRASGPVPK